MTLYLIFDKSCRHSTRPYYLNGPQLTYYTLNEMLYFWLTTLSHAMKTKCDPQWLPHRTCKAYNMKVKHQSYPV